MRLPLRFVRTAVVLAAIASISAWAQTTAPTFTVVNTGLSDSFGNAGKGVLDPQTKGFAGVAFGNDLFVAVAISSNDSVFRWATSPDGLTWTARSQPTPSGSVTAQTSKIHFINGKFIFFTGYGGNASSTWCYFSTDGLTWTGNKVADSRINVEEFDSSPTLTVAAAHNGAQVASADLVTWTSQPVVAGGSGYDHLDLTYGAGKFFSSINGFGGATYSSPDGVTWTTIPTLSTIGGSRVEAGNGFIVGTASGSQYKSTDGVTFTKLTLTVPTGWFAPGGTPRYTSAGFVALGTNLTTFKSGYMISSDAVAWTPLGMLPDAPAAPTGFIVRAYTYGDIAYGAGKFVMVGQDTSQAAFSILNQPLVVTLTSAGAPSTATEPQSQAVSAGGSATLSTSAAGTIQWQRNGANLSGATAGSLALTNVQPANAGIYTAVSTSGTATTVQHAIVGVSTSSKVIGSGTELLPVNISHPNGNVFDQVLMTGAAETITADYTLNQVTRTSFIDLNDDIVQVEFSGPGTLSLVLDNPSGPAAPVKYNQATVSYMKGHAGIVITGANENTNVSVFTVGRATAFDPTGGYNILLAPGPTNNPTNNGSSLFQGQGATAYDGIADIAYIAISSTNGKFGGVRSAGASYFATKGLTGIYAPGVQFTGPLFVGDIAASDSATPVLQVGAVSDARITGGDLLQANGQAVQVSGITQLKFTAGSNSHGVTLPAQANRAVLLQGTTNVTAQIVVNP